MAELKITLTEQDLARLPKSVSATLLEYLQQYPDTTRTQNDTPVFEYPPEWMPISKTHRQRKLKVVSIDEACEFSRMLFDRELPIFKKFFQNKVVDGSSLHCEKLKVFDNLGNWGPFGLLAFLCGLDGPRKIYASVTLNEMVRNMQGHGLNNRYIDGKSVTPLIKEIRITLNEFYHEQDTFHLFATTSWSSKLSKPSAALIFATGTREAFKEALTEIANE